MLISKYTGRIDNPHGTWNENASGFIIDSDDMDRAIYAEFDYGQWTAYPIIDSNGFITIGLPIAGYTDLGDLITILTWET